MNQNQRMRLALDAVVVILIIVFTFWTIQEFSSILDRASWEANQQIDEAGASYFDDYHWEKYKVQAVESHVIGAALGLALGMGLFVFFLSYKLEVLHSDNQHKGFK